MKVTEELEKVLEDGLFNIENASNADEIEKLRIQFLGKKGLISGCMKELRNLSTDDRPKAGKIANEVRTKLIEAFETKKND